MRRSCAVQKRIFARVREILNERSTYNGTTDLVGRISFPQPEKHHARKVTWKAAAMSGRVKISSLTMKKRLTAMGRQVKNR